jgi:hypothetical protein
VRMRDKWGPTLGSKTNQWQISAEQRPIIPWAGAPSTTLSPPAGLYLRSPTAAGGRISKRSRRGRMRIRPNAPCRVRHLVRVGGKSSRAERLHPRAYVSRMCIVARVPLAVGAGPVSLAAAVTVSGTGGASHI